LLVYAGSQASEVVVARVEGALAFFCFFGYGSAFLRGDGGFPVGDCPCYAGVFVLAELDDQARDTAGVDAAVSNVVALESRRHRKERDRNGDARDNAG